MEYERIQTDEALRDFCRSLADAKAVAFDTEFVAEDTFRPVLCLIQVAAAGRLAVIDPMTISDVTPFWEAVSRPGVRAIVHAGRGELEFCRQAIGRFPSDVFDVQLAAGFIGLEYPAGYGALVHRILKESPKKHETRTDWRRRPLSQRQLEYALDDVRYLEPLQDAIVQKLTELDRLAWLEDETAAWLDEICRSQTQERWRRIAGNSRLGSQSLGIVRELWRWRQGEAERRDRPARSVLRDDLIVELARRQSGDIKQIQAIRGMEWGRVRSQIPAIAAAIREGLAAPEPASAASPYRENVPQLALLGQFLSAALGSLCRQQSIAVSLVGGPNDVRELVLYRTQRDAADREIPSLARGWRAQVVGRLIDDLLDGKMAIRIVDPMSTHPLVVE